MRTPAHWLTPPDAPGLKARSLAPLGEIYGLLTALRLRKSGTSVPVPVICVGNLNAGGTGKTPTTIALVEFLKALGVSAHVVSRGHGGRAVGPIRVEAEHDAAEVGDEPLLIAAFAPTWVAKDRLAGAQSAVAAGAEAVLLDDGHQNPSLNKDLSLVVVDAHVGFGNGLMIPAGPLREPIQTGLQRANAVLAIGGPEAQTRFASRWAAQVRPCPLITGHLEPLPTGMPWRNLPTVAFAGIGHPEKFFATLRGLGADVLRAEALADHQPLTEAMMTRLDADARRYNAQLVTTEKDAVRLPASFRSRVLTLPVRLQVPDWGPFGEALKRLAAGNQPS